MISSLTPAFMTPEVGYQLKKKASAFFWNSITFAYSSTCDFKTRTFKVVQDIGDRTGITKDLELASQIGLYFIDILDLQKPLELGLAIKKTREQLQIQNPGCVKLADFFEQLILQFCGDFQPTLRKKINSFFDFEVFPVGSYAEKALDTYTYQSFIEQILIVNMLFALNNFVSQTSKKVKGNDLFLKILSSIVEEIEKSGAELENILKIEETAVRKEQLQIHFQHLAENILMLFFPNKSWDLQIFYPATYKFVLPIPRSLMASKAWEMAIKEIGRMMLSFYEESENVFSADEIRKENAGLDERMGVEGAHRLFHLPSTLLSAALKTDKRKILNYFQVPLEQFLEKNKISNRLNISALLMSNLSKLFTTQDPHLLKLGGCVERYFMQRLLNQVWNTSSLSRENFLVPGALDWIVQGFDQFQNTHSYSQFADHLLALGGLNKKETLPLPSFLKEAVGSKLQTALQKAIVAFLKKPMGLLQDMTRETSLNRHTLVDLTNNPFFDAPYRKANQRLVDLVFNLLASSTLDFSSQIKNRLPFKLFTAKQIKVYQDQMVAFVSYSYNSNVVLKRLMQNMLDHVVFQGLIHLDTQLKKQQLTQSEQTVCQAIAKDIFTQLPKQVASYESILEKMNQEVFKGKLVPKDLSILAKEVKKMSKKNLDINNLISKIKEFALKKAILIDGMDLQIYADRIKRIALTPEQIIEKYLTKTEGDQNSKRILAEGLDEVLSRREEELEPLWLMAEKYATLLLMKGAACIKNGMQLEKDSGHQIYIRLQQLMQQPSSAAKHEIKDLVDQFLSQFLYVTTQDDLIDLPSSLRPVIFSMLKKTLTSRFASIHKAIYQHLHSLPVIEGPLSEIVEDSVLNQACRSMTKYGLDATIDLAAQSDKKEIASSIRKTINRYSLEGNHTAFVLKDILTEDALISQLIKGVEWLSSKEARSYTRSLSKLGVHILKKPLINALSPLIVAEKREGKAFEQALLLCILSPLIQHVRHLNVLKQQGKIVEAQASYKNKKAQHLYQQHSQQLLDLLYPKGAQDLPFLIPELQTIVWKKLHALMPQLIEKGVQSLLKPKLFSQLLDKTYASLDQFLSEPTRSSVKTVPALKNSPIMTQAESILQQKIGRQMFKLTKESARFINLPVSTLEDVRSQWLKKQLRAIRHTIQTMLGKGISNQLKGDLISRSIKTAIQAIANKTYQPSIKKPVFKAPLSKNKKLEIQEKQLVKKMIAYLGRTIRQTIDKSLSVVFKGFVGRAVKAFILAIGHFITVTLVGALLRCLGVSKAILRAIRQQWKTARQETLAVFQNPELHVSAISKITTAFTLFMKDQAVV